MSKLAVSLSFAAGLAGGIIGSQLAPAIVHAETTSEIRAHKFVLVNHNGEVVGTFALDAAERPVIRLFENGRETWSADGSTIRPLTMK